MAKTRSRRSEVVEPYLYLPLEDDFPDVTGGDWKLRDSDKPMDLREVLLYTVRRCPVKTGEDAERALELFQALKEAENANCIQLRKADFDWMLTHFHQMAHTVWLAPDSAYLRKWLRENVRTTPLMNIKAFMEKE